MGKEEILYPRMVYCPDDRKRHKVVKDADEEKAILAEWAMQLGKALPEEKDQVAEAEKVEEVLEEAQAAAEGGKEESEAEEVDYKKLKVAELKEILVKKFEYEEASLEGHKKADLLALIDEELEG